MLHHRRRPRRLQDGALDGGPGDLNLVGVPAHRLRAGHGRVGRLRRDRFRDRLAREHALGRLRPPRHRRHRAQHDARRLHGRAVHHAEHRRQRQRPVVRLLEPHLVVSRSAGRARGRITCVTSSFGCSTVSPYRFAFGIWKNSPASISRSPCGPTTRKRPP